MNLSAPRPIPALTCLAAVLFGTASAETVIIAINDDVVPRGNGKYSSFNLPTISNSRQAAFLTLLSATSGGAADYTGLFRGDGSSAFEIARKGMSAPDGNGIFSAFNDPALNNNDVTVFIAQFTGTTDAELDNSGIFKADGLTAPVQIVREGQAAPDGIGVFSSFDLYYIMNDAGNAAFNATIDLLNGGTRWDQDGVFRGDGVTAPVQIARRGQLAPSGNGSYSVLYNASLNESNQVAFRALLTGTSGGANDNDGLFRGDGISSTIDIVREGDALADGNGEFYIFNTLFINDAGQVAFFANLRNTTGGAADDQGIFRGDGVSGPVTIAREGQTVPGGTDTFSNFGIGSINNAGQVASTVEINLNDGGGPSDEYGVIVGDGTPGSLIMVARQGQTAPDGTGTLLSFSPPALNNAGQLAFQGWIDKPAPGSDRALFFFAPLDGLYQVVREGASFYGSTLTSFEFSSPGGYNSEGRTGLNDSGEVAFKFQLSNGKRGIARWSTAPGPVIPLQITDFQIQFEPWGDATVTLEWKTSSAATSFNIRYSEDLRLPPASWPIFVGSIPRNEPTTRYEGYLPFFFYQPEKLFFIVEEVNQSPVL